MAASVREEVLSDVHVFNVSHIAGPRNNKESEVRYLSRFHFHWDEAFCRADSTETWQSSALTRNNVLQGKDMDEDGDPILARRHDKQRSNIETESSPRDLVLESECRQDPTAQKYQDRAEWLECLHVITIEHKMETCLFDVGFQVWSGALLMCDYLLSIHSELNKAHVVDLGSGTGITSIVAAMFASCVVCTDYSNDVVKLAERNWLRNKDFFVQNNCTQMYFKVLDWTVDYPPVVDVNEDDSSYRLSSKELDLIEMANIYISAEVVYDEDLTQAFFKTAYYLLSKSPPKVLYIALEKRIVFSSEHHQVCSPAYDAFLEHLEDLASVDSGPVRFSIAQVATDFPQCFEYSRTKYLELWKISSAINEKG